MKQTLMAATVVSGLLGLGGVHAAAGETVQLRQMEGSVLVNQGELFRSATEGMSLQVGDRVMVMEGGAMVLVYPDGCRSDFKDNQIITIESVSPCEGGTAQYQAMGPLYAEPMGGGAAAGGAAAGILPLYVGGGAVIAGAIITNNRNDDKNASGE